MITPIIIDNSYATYYNGFACWSWWTREFGKKGIPLDGTFDPMTDKEFKAAYERKFLTRIYNVVKKHVVFFNKSDLIFALDCNRKNIWRNEIFPEYKMLRKEKQKQREFSWNGIFNFTNDILLPKYKEEYGCRILQQRHSEGDDIIAVIVNELSKKYKDIIVVASDGDLVQLANKCTIITLKGDVKTPESVIAKYKFKNADDGINWTTGNYLLHKTIMGDSGDEIPPIISQFGPKRALKYINNIELLKEAIQKDPEVGVRLKRNDTLINFDNIPKEIKEEILQQWYSERSEDISSL